MPNEQVADVELLMSHLGDFGRYQLVQFLLHLLAALTAGIHMLSLTTVAAVPEHRCMIPNLENDTYHLSDNSTEFHEWIPESMSSNFRSCQLLDPLSNGTSFCNKWIYDNTYYESTRAIEWDLVCNRRWMGAIAQSSYMFGVFTGAVTLGSLADRYGRKTIFYISAVLQLFLGTGIAFVNQYYLFLVIAFLYGIFGSAGSYITAFVLSMEIVGPSKRTVCGVLFQATFAVGIMLVAFWGYLIKDYVTLQLTYGLHSLLLIGHWWLIDESPRWLWSCGRISESVAIVEKGVRINKRPEFSKVHFISRGKAKLRTDDTATAGISDMFKTPFLRKKTLNLSLNWFANSLVYYGLSLNTGNLKGNPYLVLFLMGLVELPGYFVTILLLDRTGRRFLISMFMIVGSMACLATALIPSELGTVINTVVFIGKFCIASSFAIIYNYSAELFPTVLRNTGLGFGSMCARFSATLTPLITLLDSFDKRVPTIVFASVALVSGVLTTLLPETLGHPMPQSLEDGENFGRGDTCFSTGCIPRFTGKNKKADIQGGEEEEEDTRPKEPLTES